jgi:peptidoglycan hydrolase CwlO-like protein
MSSKIQFVIHHDYSGNRFTPVPGESDFQQLLSLKNELENDAFKLRRKINTKNKIIRSLLKKLAAHQQLLKCTASSEELKLLLKLYTNLKNSQELK